MKTTETNLDPFALIENEQNIPIDVSHHEFKFTRSWFKSRNQKTWSSFLIPKFGDGRSIKMVQIGVFEGMDLVHCLQNILTHPDSRVVAIDPWLGTTKLDQRYMEECYQRAVHNLSPWHGNTNKVNILRRKSEDVLSQLEGNYYDLIIIDGDHNAEPVYQDSIQALRLIKPGGWIVWDDVRNRTFKKNHVLHGLNKFLAEHGNEVKLEWKYRYCDCYSRL